MSFYWFKMFIEWKNMKIKEPKSQMTFGKQKVIIKNTSTDDFMKIHLPWIL